MRDDSHDLRSELHRIVCGAPWLVEVLETVRRVGPAAAYVGAGAIRDTVWDVLHGRSTAAPAGDIDVVYFSIDHHSIEGEARLKGALPRYRWEVTNQATVHEWQSAELGRAIAPYASIVDALRVWPETATSVAVALDPDGILDIVAPHGLEDLFAMRVRASPNVLDLRDFLRRAVSKQWSIRWPQVTVELHGAVHD